MHLYVYTYIYIYIHIIIYTYISIYMYVVATFPCPQEFYNFPRGNYTLPTFCLQFHTFPPFSYILLHFRTQGTKKDSFQSLHPQFLLGKGTKKGQFSVPPPPILIGEGCQKEQFSGPPPPISSVERWE